MFKVPEKYRQTKGKMGTTTLDGNKGLFLLPMVIQQKDKKHQFYLACSAKQEHGWESVSVYCISKNGDIIPRKPNHDELAYVREKFWAVDDTVVTFIKQSIPTSLHDRITVVLWRSQFQIMPLPKVEYPTFTINDQDKKIDSEPH